MASRAASASAGQAIHFNSAQNYTYTIATASSGIVGFDATDFTLDTTAFANALNGGTWSLATGNAGHDLNLTFTASAIPEPDTYAAIMGTAALALTAWRRGKRKPV